MNNNCELIVDYPLIKVDENGRKATIINEGRESYLRAKVDGCLLKNQTAADWVISKDGIGHLIIELKGCDVNHAIKQIEHTIAFWRNHKRTNGPFSALIVCSRHPSIDTTLQRAKLRLAKTYNMPIHVYTKNYQYRFDSLFRFKNPLRK